MNKKLLFAVSGIILLITSGLLYVFLTPQMTTRVDKMTAPSQQTPAPQSETATKPASLGPGAYRDYSEDAVLATKGTKLLFFHAPWCSQCRAIEASINNDGIPDGVTVFKVDYDSNQALRQRYGVTLQTTFVKIDDAGEKIESYVAYEEPAFSSVERELLR